MAKMQIEVKMKDEVSAVIEEVNKNLKGIMKLQQDNIRLLKRVLKHSFESKVVK
jgi:hypothetical protein